MTKEQKSQQVSLLLEQLEAYPHFYVTDTSGLDAGTTSSLRRMCFQKEVKMLVVKNTLFRRALQEKSETTFEDLIPSLKGNSTIIFTHKNNEPAKIIKEFRKKSEKPILKAAYVEESIYVGDNQVDALATLKSKTELIAEVISLLESPAKNVVSQLSSAQNKLTGVLTSLSERA